MGWIGFGIGMGFRTARYGRRAVRYSTRRSCNRRRQPAPPAYRPRHIPSEHHCERCPTRTPVTPPRERPDSVGAFMCALIGFAALVVAIGLIVNDAAQILTVPGAALGCFLCLGVAAMTFWEVWRWANFVDDTPPPPPRKPARIEPSPKLPPEPPRSQAWYSNRR